MIRPILLSEVEIFCQESLGACLFGADVSFTNVCTDTRKLAAGDLFVALKGDRFDAHDFLAQAAEKNICAAIVERHIPQANVPQLVVSDTTKALGQIAAMNRQSFNGPVLAITGSSGKTTVKAMLASVLSEVGAVLATQGNLNNHIGVPLTLLSLSQEHEFAVIEMGASGPNEIAYSCSLAKPHITMINNVMPAHIEGFGSLEGVAHAKGEIYQCLEADDIAVANKDDLLASLYADKIPAKVFWVSLTDDNADCYAKNIRLAVGETDFDLVMDGESIAVRLHALGEHNVKNALMAAAMAYVAGASLSDIRDGIAKFQPVNGRLKSYQGVSGSRIIDDSYNANPGSVRAAIDVLTGLQGEKVLVLGDLGELGPDAEILHAQLGDYAKEKSLNYLLTLGSLSKNASHHFGEGAHHFESREDLIDFIKSQANNNITYLIKGSRSAKMDLVVAALCQSGDLH